MCEKNLNPYLIFVTKFTCETCGEKYVMWRNFRFLYMANVENCKILTIVENFLFLHMTDVKNLKFPCFVAKSVGQRFTLFYREICFVPIYALFVWRQLLAKNVQCGEKMTNMMYDEYSIALENIPRPLPVVIISHQVLEKCLGNIWKVVEKYLTNIRQIFTGLSRLS